LLIFSTVIYGCDTKSSDTEFNYSGKTSSGRINSNGQKAPDFTLYDLEGGKVKLSDYYGKIVILNFWATWCPPCRKEIPDLISIQNEYKDDLVVIGISLDQPSTQNDLQPFIDYFGINYPVVLGTLEVVIAYGNIQAIPTSFIIDREGNIINKHIGLVPKSILIEEIISILN